MRKEVVIADLSLNDLESSEAAGGPTTVHRKEKTEIWTDLEEAAASVFEEQKGKKAETAVVSGSVRQKKNLVETGFLA